MTAYTLHFDHLDGDTSIRPLTIEGETTRDLAQAVHRHARGRLGSRTVDIHLDETTLTGSVLRNGTVVGEFTLLAGEASQPNTDRAPKEVRHGYTLADIDHLTRLTLRMDRWHNAGDVTERRDAVWFAIVECLLTADTAPTRGELLRAGTEGSDALVRGEMRTHGRCTQNVGQPMPMFYRYWNPTHTPSPEPRVVEREALAQIWPQLRASEQRALSALAATGDYEKAAAAVGVAKGTFTVQISTARRRFLAAWHEHETPSRVWRTDRRVSSRTGRDHLGRQRLNAQQVDAYRQRHHAGETLRALAAECGLTSTGLSRLINGKTKPAQEVAA